MARFHGSVGFVETTEVVPGVWEEVATERNYYGDVVRNNMRWQTGTGINDDIQVVNKISIVADSYANEHLGCMRYLNWKGTLWKLTSIEVEYPRVLLTIGGVWNGVTPVASDGSGDDSGE